MSLHDFWNFSLMILIRTEKGNQYKSFLSLYFHKTRVISPRCGSVRTGNISFLHWGPGRAIRSARMNQSNVNKFYYSVRAGQSGLCVRFSPERGWPYICCRRTRLRFCLSSDIVLSAERFMLMFNTCGDCPTLQSDMTERCLGRPLRSSGGH